MENPPISYIATHDYAFIKGVEGEKRIRFLKTGCQVNKEEIHFDYKVSGGIACCGFAIEISKFFEEFEKFNKRSIGFYKQEILPSISLNYSQNEENKETPLLSIMKRHQQSLLINLNTNET